MVVMRVVVVLMMLMMMMIEMMINHCLNLIEVLEVKKLNHKCLNCDKNVKLLVNH